jgi:hypothetical protein
MIMTAIQNRHPRFLLALLATTMLMLAFQSCATTRVHHGCGCGMEEHMGQH